MSSLEEPPPGSTITDELGHVFVRGEQWWTCACDDHSIDFGWEEVRADAVGTYTVKWADGRTG